jgi:hypothetical protein
MDQPQHLERLANFGINESMTANGNGQVLVAGGMKFKKIA